MSVKLTEQQKLAVDCRHGSLIVSAAAGAGKTAVLVQRVLGLLTEEEDPCGVDELLIVTFTNAAAGEMRQRIGDALRSRLAERPDDVRLRRQLALLGSSRIQTVHAFCQSLIREHFALCGVEPDFALVDETQAAMLQEQALADTLEAAYQKAEPQFLQLCDNLTDGRTDRVLTNTVMQIYQRIRSHPSPETLLTSMPVMCVSDPDNVTWMRDIRKNAAERLRYEQKSLEKTAEIAKEDGKIHEKYAPVLAEYQVFTEELLRALDAGWDETRRCLAEFSVERAPTCRGVDKEVLEQVKAGRERFLHCIAELSGSVFTQSSQQIADEGRQCEPMIRALCGLVLDFSERYQQEKRQRGLLDFNDLEHFALRLLVTPEGAISDIARQLQKQFREVLVDEYQDTNEIQESIFRALRGQDDQAFFVGDIKQSIYRFRLAEPGLFLDRYIKSKTFTGTETGAIRLALNRNFRSRPEVLSLCNFIFSRLMSHGAGDVDYDEDQRLNAGRKTEGTVPCEVLLFNCPRKAPDEERDSRGVLEARLTAQRIARLLREERVPEGEGTRPAQPEDVAILLSSFSNKAPVYQQELQRLGIPCGGSGGAFFGVVETSVMLSLLRLLLNRRQDIPLISVLRSPLYLATPDLLAQLRLLAPEGDLIDGLEACAAADPLCAKVLSDLDRWHDAAAELPLSRLVRLIYDETGAEGVFAALDNGVQRVRNLQRLEDMTRAFDAGPGGLSAFLRWIDRKLASDEAPDAQDTEAAGVRMLSIHRSKGLEFPFVIVPDLAKPFNTDDLKLPVMFHTHMGIGLRLRDAKTHTEHPTQMQLAVTEQLRRELRSEELRKLYVAMTRAREKLILILSSTSMDKTISEVVQETDGAPSPEWVIQQGNAMNWLIAALASHPSCGLLRRSHAEAVSISADGSMDDLICREISIEEIEDGDERLTASAEAPPDTEEEADAFAALLERSKQEYPYRQASLLPSKLTATGLRAMQEQGTAVPSEPAEDETEDYSLDRVNETALLRGTAMHALIQRADLSRCGTKEAVLEQARALLERGYLTAQQLPLIDSGAVCAFAQSELGARTRAAERCLREYEFSVLLHASDLLKDAPEGENVLVNGAIDLLLFEPDGMTVIDFKTDRVRPENAKQKAEEHRQQLMLYERAACEIFQKPVKEKWVWFLRIGEGVLL